MSEERSSTANNTSVMLWISSGRDAYWLSAVLRCELQPGTLEKIVALPIFEGSSLAALSGIYQLYLRTTRHTSEEVMQTVLGHLCVTSSWPSRLLKGTVQES